MSWTESEKLNEWIERAFENGRAEEQERIIKLLEEIEALHIHIEGLQATLAKRNARIAELEAKVTKQGSKIQTEMAVRRAYNKGWKDCASKLAETTRLMALQLREVRSEAWRVYSEGENK